MRIIVFSLKLALQPPLSSEQLLITAIAWQSFLESTIPEKDLQSTFERALRFHETSFAVNAQDILRHYVPSPTDEETKMRQAILESQEYYYANQRT